MKKSGSVSEFLGLRDRELAEAFASILRTADMPLRDMFAAAAASPCSRFWVGELRAERVVRNMINAGLSSPDDPDMLPKKREMYAEICRLTKNLMEADPSLSLPRAVELAVNSPAPEFYITEKSAKVIIYSIRRRRKKERQ